MLGQDPDARLPAGERPGRDSLTDDSPTRLPEALRALQSGKAAAQGGPDPGCATPRRYEADTSGRNPGRLWRGTAQAGRPSGLSAFDIKSARIDSLRHLAESLDLLFRRLPPPPAWGAGWFGREVGRIKKWLTAA